MTSPETVSPGEGRRTAGTVATAALSAVLGFVAVATWGAHATPWPEGFEVTAKLEHLAEHGAEYDAVFVGSSNVYRSYVPAVFDAHMAAHGVPLRTFNLGGPSMFSYESDFVLRHLLAMEGLELELVFMEPGDWDSEPKVEEEITNMLSNRSVFWHDLRQTTNVLRSIARADSTPARKLFLARKHVQAFLWKISSYGQGKRIWNDLFGPGEPPALTPEQLERGEGYVALEAERGPVMQARRRLLLDDLPGFWEKVAAIEEGNARPLDPDAYCRVAIPRQVDLIRAAGAEPVYLVAPVSHETHWAYRLAEEGVIRLLGFNHPKRYPQLYTPERHFDPNHLSRAGAHQFSILLAAELAAYLRAELGR